MSMCGNTRVVLSGKRREILAEAIQVVLVGAEVEVAKMAFIAVKGIYPGFELRLVLPKGSCPMLLSREGRAWLAASKAAWI